MRIKIDGFADFNCEPIKLPKAFSASYDSEVVICDSNRMEHSIYNKDRATRWTETDYNTSKVSVCGYDHDSMISIYNSYNPDCPNSMIGLDIGHNSNESDQIISNSSFVFGSSGICTLFYEQGNMFDIKDLTPQVSERYLRQVTDTYGSFCNVKPSVSDTLDLYEPINEIDLEIFLKGKQSSESDDLRRGGGFQDGGPYR